MQPWSQIDVPKTVDLTVLANGTIHRRELGFTLTAFEGHHALYQLAQRYCIPELRLRGYRLNEHDFNLLGDSPSTRVLSVEHMTVLDVDAVDYLIKNVGAKFWNLSQLCCGSMHPINHRPAKSRLNWLERGWRSLNSTTPPSLKRMSLQGNNWNTAVISRLCRRVRTEILDLRGNPITDKEALDLEKKHKTTVLHDRAVSEFSQRFPLSRAPKL